MRHLFLSCLINIFLFYFANSIELSGTNSFRRIRNNQEIRYEDFRYVEFEDANDTLSIKAMDESGNIIMPCLDLWQLDMIKSKLVERGIKRIIIIISTLPPSGDSARFLAETGIITHEYTAEFSNKLLREHPFIFSGDSIEGGMASGAATGERYIWINPSITALTEEEILVILEHEHWHIYMGLVNESYKERWNKLIEDVRTKFLEEKVEPGVSLVGLIDHIQMRRLQIRECIDSALRETSLVVSLAARNSESGEFISKEKAKEGFLKDYFDSGILGFKLEGRRDLAEPYEGELKAIYSKYLSNEEMDDIIRGSVSYVEQLLINRDISYVPAFGEIENLLNSMEW